MHSEPQRCFRLQPLRISRRQFVHYYSASYLTLLKIRISLFEYHPNTGIILTFVPYDTHFLHYRQISFYHPWCLRHGYRQSLRHLLSVTNSKQKDNILVFNTFPYRHITDISPTFFSDIYIGITATITATLPPKQYLHRHLHRHLHRQNSINLLRSQTNY